MGDDSIIPGIIGVGVGLLAVGLAAKIAVDVVKETGRLAKKRRYKSNILNRMI